MAFAIDPVPRLFALPRLLGSAAYPAVAADVALPESNIIVYFKENASKAAAHSPFKTAENPPKKAKNPGHAAQRRLGNPHRATVDWPLLLLQGRANLKG